MPVRPVPNVKTAVVFDVIVPEPPKLMVVPFTITFEFANPELAIVVLMADAGMLIVVLDAAVN